MRSRVRIAMSLAAVMGASSLLGAAAPAGATARPTEPSLTGSAQLLRLDGQDVRFTFDAHGCVGV